MEKFLIILVLVVLGFIFFCIYFIFKQMQFVIQAINLYKDMVTRQDMTIKLLKDIRDRGLSINKQRNNLIENDVSSKCKNCGETITDDSSSQFCDNCGAKL